MRQLSVQGLFFCVIATALAALGSAAVAAEHRLVVELRPDQPQSHLEQITAEVFDAKAEVSPMFPEIDPGDDPYALRNLYTVGATSGDASESPWDMAYLLRDRGNFLRVEPDFEDVLVDPTARALFCSKSNDDESTADPAWSLLAVNADQAWELTPPESGQRFGEGVRVCHLDTGWTEHADLDAARLDLDNDYDILDEDDNALDPLNYRGSRGHGTSTGSLIVSSGGIDENGGTLPPGKITGMAPEATLVPMRSVKSVIQFLDSDVAKAVRRSVEASCDVIAMSVGGRIFFGLERALMDAVRHEVIPVAAAGNCVPFVVAPAVYDATVAVAASNVHAVPWKGSSRGRSVDISAPGERVHVAWKKSPEDSSTNTIRSDGTSYAAAYAAGAAALWIAHHGEQAIREAYGSGTRKDLFVELLKRSANTPDGWDSSKYGAGILDAAALLRSPLGTPDDTARRAVSPVPHLELLARVTGRDREQLRAHLQELFGADDFSAAIDRFGPELMHIAVHQPESMQSMLNNLASDAGSGATARRTARLALSQLGSKTLIQSLSSAEPTVGRHDSAQAQPKITQRVLLEIDRMRGTQAVSTEQTIRGKRVSLAEIYRAAGIELRIVEDQIDIPHADSIRLADLHALLITNRSLTAEEGEWHVYMLVVSEDEDSRDTLGIMFDFGENDANDMPRESFAVFESAHKGMPGGVIREVLLTTAHELAHVFNLHHTDWDGSSFTRRATVESYSLTDTVLWRLSDASIEHFHSHPSRLVTPGTGNLPFGLITQSHAGRHKLSPRENYSVVPDDTSNLNRRTSIDASAAMRTRLAPVNDISTESPLRLRIGTAKEVYLVGEAVSLAVAVVNTSDTPQEVIPLLSPEYGFLNVLIRGPTQEQFQPFKPPVLRGARMARLSRTLAPNDVMIDDARVFFSSGGWTFATPGDYEIQATFPADTAFSSDIIRSETLLVTIEPPTTEPTKRASRLLFDKGGLRFGIEQGLYLYMGGGDHLSYGADRLRQLVHEFPLAAQADPAKIALANEALRPTIDQARGGRPEPRLDEAQQYLRGLQEMENVPGVSLMRVQQRLVRELEAAGRDAEARSLREDFADDLQRSKDLQFIDRELLERGFE
ncbi:MAG: S8 family serine peptidase [Proteobacteria bacterium]|nr:S8 family serine peptidase [Pseudomonadota bacterium]